MKRFILFIALLIPILTFSQTPHAETLFTVGNENVSADEFVKVYLKSSPAKDADFSEKSLQDYLALYVNFRLKVKEARELVMDTLSNVLTELNTYRAQLAKNYMTDTVKRNQLIDEAYDRMQKEVHVEHILIRVDPNATPEVVAAAEKRIMKIKKMIEGGKDFNQIAKDSSQDKSAVENGGDLGYFTAMQMIYKFETAAYKTPVGKMTVVKTKYGFHLIKVLDVRQAHGTMQVAHIFVKTGKNATENDLKRAKIKIDSIYELLQKGANFEDLAKNLSEDKSSSNDGGKLPVFWTGKLVLEFESAAYALKNIGDISKPVQSRFGWDIIKLLQRNPLPTEKEQRDQIKKNIDKDSRSEEIHIAFIDSLKSRYYFSEAKGSKDKLFTKIDTSFLKGNWKASMAAGFDKPLFTLTDKIYTPEVKVFTQTDFANYIEATERKIMGQGNKEMMYDKIYSQFVESSLTNFFDARLEKMYPKFAELMKEYMDGILLFNLTNEKVWLKAVSDTAGLRNYYSLHGSEYLGGQRANVEEIKILNSTIMLSYAKYLSKGKSFDWIAAKLNKKTPNAISKKSYIVEQGKNSEVEKFGWELNKEYVVTSDTGIRLITIKEFLPALPKPLVEVQGYIVADYQDELEKQWISSLKKKYPVKVNDDILKKLVKH